LKICLVHNAYGKVSGEEVVVEGLATLLAARGHTVLRFSRSSEEIPGKFLGSAQAFLAGIYNPFARRLFGRFLDTYRPDVVHAHNLFPFLSPAILPECTRRRVPVVLTLHNYRFLCPNALLLRVGRPCHECVGGHEWRCVWHNCERSFAKSLGYALRTAFARRSGLVLRHVNEFICLTEFQRDLHVRAGFPADRMTVVPNPAPEKAGAQKLKAEMLEAQTGRRETEGSRTIEQSDSGRQYVGYLGRVSFEKDVPTLVAAARRLPEIPFRVAGSYWRMEESVKHAPPNVEFLGHVEGERLREFFAGMRLLAFATRFYEGFPMVLVEAMVRGIPIVCTRIGGLPEIVEDGQTGLLYEPGDAADLAAKISALWKDAALRERLTQAAAAKVQRLYSPDAVYEKLGAVYARAAEGARGKAETLKR